jgi:aspartate-semialdehyde dehydrogenase
MDRRKEVLLTGATGYVGGKLLRRLTIPVTVLTPWLSSHRLGLVTPLYATVGKILIEGIRNSTIVESPRAGELFTIKPGRMAEAIQQALADREPGIVIS